MCNDSDDMNNMSGGWWDGDDCCERNIRANKVCANCVKAECIKSLASVSKEACVSDTLQAANLLSESASFNSLCSQSGTINSLCVDNLNVNNFLDRAPVPLQRVV